MSLNLRLDDDRASALREHARREGVGPHAAVLRAVDEYLSATDRRARVRRTARQQAEIWRELPDRLKWGPTRRPGPHKPPRPPTSRAPRPTT
ncbi:CopG family transcriptional regulator [Streptomyces sp. URMC 126]|uniref:CopG family transcriptional regulator n=1 Tax=Streptomyces sp. URMC 126 TaxID=3423401 RepID=UPI003F1D6DCC